MPNQPKLRAICLRLSAVIIGACSDSTDIEPPHTANSARAADAGSSPAAADDKSSRVKGSDSVFDSGLREAATPAAGARAHAAADGGQSRRPEHDAGAREAGPVDRDEDAADSGSDNCVTRIAYGSAWIPPTNHGATNWDDVPGLVTWDGSCKLDASGNSFAELSNGWRPFFQGSDHCVIALDVRGSCAPADSCSTRVSYGASWIPAAGHVGSSDDVAGVLTTDGVCSASGDQSYLTLSNGWRPYFKGIDGCAVALRYNQCGGLFANPVIAEDCPDPGVLRDADQYVLTCTSGGPEYPILSSTDLVHWTHHGSIFSRATAPQWASKDFWAPEIHRVGDHFVAYFSARHTDGVLAIGAASSDNVFGPYRDTGAPLLRDAQGAIDAHQFEAPDGTRYLLWKVDGNASGEPTPIQLQPLTPDGLALTETATTLISNSLAWEGSVVEGPWLIYEAGYYYLFYSGNAYASEQYALGVARSESITGPYTKAAAPILVTGGGWAGPGHGSVVRSPEGGWVFVFHAWLAQHVGQSPPGRQVLLARIDWQAGWPKLQGAPSSVSQPLP